MEQNSLYGFIIRSYFFPLIHPINEYRLLWVRKENDFQALIGDIIDNHVKNTQSGGSQCHQCKLHRICLIIPIRPSSGEENSDYKMRKACNIIVDVLI